MRNKWVFMPLVALGFLVLFALGGEVVKLLWNWLVPPIIGWREITFWQGFGLLALCRILFGGFGSHGGRGKWRGRHRMGGGMADRMAGRWEQMAPEERERFRQRVRERFGSDPATGENREV